MVGNAMKLKLASYTELGKKDENNSQLRRSLKYDKKITFNINTSKRRQVKKQTKI